MRWHSGLFCVIALAIDCSTIVFPASDGATMRPRWPLPIGATRSMTRVVRLLGLGLQPQPLLRVERRELAELDPRLGLVRLQAVDGVEADQGVELLPAAGAVLRLLALAGRLDRAGDGVALAQRVPLDQAERYVDVVGPGQVPGGADEGVVVEHVEDAGHRDEDVVVGDLELGFVLLRRPGRAAAALPVAAALAAAPTAAAGLVVVVGLLRRRRRRLRGRRGRWRRLALPVAVWRSCCRSCCRSAWRSCWRSAAVGWRSCWGRCCGALGAFRPRRRVGWSCRWSCRWWSEWRPERRQERPRCARASPSRTAARRASAGRLESRRARAPARPRAGSAAGPPPRNAERCRPGAR